MEKRRVMKTTYGAPASGRTAARSAEPAMRHSETGAYVDGNTVRRFSVVENPQRTEPAQRPKQHPSRHAAKQQVQVVHFGLKYVLMLTLCAALTFWNCIGYLQVQAENTKSLKHISSLEKQLSDLKTENNDTYNRLMSSVDLNAIRERAVNELGMVYAEPDQVVLYDGEMNDYVRQYGEMPQEEKSLWDRLKSGK